QAALGHEGARARLHAAWGPGVRPVRRRGHDPPGRAPGGSPLGRRGGGPGDVPRGRCTPGRAVHAGARVRRMISEMRAETPYIPFSERCSVLDRVGLYAMVIGTPQAGAFFRESPAGDLVVALWAALCQRGVIAPIHDGIGAGRPPVGRVLDFGALAEA